MDLSRLNQILHHPDIWPEISGGVEPFYVEPLDDWEYVWCEGGVIIFHPYRDGMKIHPNFLPDYRGKKAFEEIERTLQKYSRVYAEIDKDLRHVNWAARFMGFRLIETGERNLYRWTL